MANKSFSAAKFIKPKKTSFLWLALFPAAALLLAKHSEVKLGEDGEFGSGKARKAYLYVFGKKRNANGSRRNRSGKAVIITNQTPSGLAGKAAKGFFGMNK